MDDGKLLRLYVRDGSEAAFGQIVTRHRALVYATCLRETGSPAQAEDAAQVVFLLLSRKAKGLRPGLSLAGWLFRTARFVAKDVRKQEARRQHREEIVREELAPRPLSPAPEWQRVEPLLNGALSALRPADRELILLRFLEGHTLAETGVALGLSEDAARMRVTRAVEKMRRWLAAHGASMTSLALAGLLTAEAARPMPAEAASAVTQGTLHALASGPTPNVLLLSKGVLHTMKIVQVKMAALAASLLLVLGSIPFVIHAAPVPVANTKIIKQAVTAGATAKSVPPLSFWQYPQESGYGTQLAIVTGPVFPECLQGTTHDPIEKAYAFYREKAANGLFKGEDVFPWESKFEKTLLVKQTKIGGKTAVAATALAEANPDPDHALMIVHQPTQTVIIKLSRNAQNRSWTDIAVIVDKH